MRIAQIAPVIERVPAKKYGGTERVVHSLTEELVKRGHDVTLFASGDSITSAKLVSVVPKSLREMAVENPYDPLNEANILNVTTAYQMQDEFDVIHDHTAQNSPLSLPMASVSKTPAIVTLHGPLGEKDIKAFERYPVPFLATISHAQAKPAPHLNYAGNVYNGLPMEHYPFSSTHRGYLLFVGRISPEKGVHFAVQAAKELNLPLVIAAKLDPVDVPYFREHIEPNLDDQIQWIGEVDETERNRLMSEAMCFLHPVTWPEPFGLTLIESMATGCPVIAFNMGSIPEIIDHGKTGFVVSTLSEMITGIKNIDGIDRSVCRKHALESFSAERMAEGYEMVYRLAIMRRSYRQLTEQVIAKISQTSMPSHASLVNLQSGEFLKNRRITHF